MGIKANAKFSAYANNATMQIIVNEQTILSLPQGGADSISVFVDKFIAQLETYKVPSAGVRAAALVEVQVPQEELWRVVSFLEITERFEFSCRRNGEWCSASETVTTSLFSDMENFEWAKEAVEYLYKEGIVHGTGDSKFSLKIMLQENNLLK